MGSSYTQYNFVRVTSFLGNWFLLNLIAKKILVAMSLRF